MIKRIFEKASAIFVIVYFFHPILSRLLNSIAGLYRDLINFLLDIVQKNILYGFLMAVIIITLILWILYIGDEEQEQEEMPAEKLEKPL